MATTARFTWPIFRPIPCTMAPLILRELTTADEASFKRAVRDFAEVDPDWQFAFDFDPASDFGDYVTRLERQRRGLDLPDGWVPFTYLVATLDDEIVGRLVLRHRLTDALQEYGGHVGYGVVPRHRRKGYATAMLAECFPVARALGLDRLLATCSPSNQASVRVIERNGGVLAEPAAPGHQLRYWIELERSRSRL